MAIPESKISDYIEEGVVLFLRVKTREEALTLLINALDEAGKLSDKQVFTEVILQRESIVSTGIGRGVAFPHAKLEGYPDFFIALGIQQEQGIEWDSIDGSLVKLIFMIGGPENRQTEYLKILSKLTMAIKDEERRRQLLKCLSAQEVKALFEGC